MGNDSFISYHIAFIFPKLIIWIKSWRISQWANLIIIYRTTQFRVNI